jgi:hypothetical protein
MLESARESRANGAEAFWDDAERFFLGTEASSLRVNETGDNPILHEQIPTRDLQIISPLGIL